MQYAIEGIALGLMLTIMLGPILIALIQTSLENGGSAGLAVGLGIWLSDLLIIASSYFALNLIGDVVKGGGFRYWLGLIGGLVLIIFGIGAFLKKVKIGPEKKYFSAKNYAGFWMKGFLVNTINPFTFIFWLGVISTYVIARKITGTQAFIFLGSILLTIITTDSIKILLAKKIKQKMQSHQLQWFNRVAGVGLFLFGIYLIYRSVLEG